MEDYTFKVNLVAVVRVRASDESVARKIVPTVLGAPGTAEIRLANENNAATGRDATITDVDFSIGSFIPARNGRPHPHAEWAPSHLGHQLAGTAGARKGWSPKETRLTFIRLTWIAPIPQSPAVRFAEWQNPASCGVLFLRGKPPPPSAAPPGPLAGLAQV